MDGLDIWKRRGELDKERREYMRKAMEDFDAKYRVKMQELRHTCAEGPGHSWKFTHLGPLGHPWFCCGNCGATKVEVA